MNSYSVINLHFFVIYVYDGFNSLCFRKSSLKYDPLPAYQRMIVHKCSEYYGLEHNTIKESMMVISKPKIYTPIEKKISDLIDR